MIAGLYWVNKKRGPRIDSLFFEPLGGLEPPTHALRMRCSTN